MTTATAVLEQELVGYLREQIRDQGIQILVLPRIMGLIEEMIITELAWEAFNKQHLADNLGIARTNLQWKLQKYGINILDRKHRSYGSRK